MIFRKLRKFLKPRLKRYPAAFRLYEAISWAFTRSAFSPKHFFPTLAAIIFPMWIAPRCRLARHYVGEGKLDKALAIAEDVRARRPDAYLDDDTFKRLAVAYSMEGRTEDLRELFDRTEDRRSEIARELQYDRLGLRFFPIASFSNIGPLGVLDKYLKAEILGITPPAHECDSGCPGTVCQSGLPPVLDEVFLIGEPSANNVASRPAILLP